MHELLVYTRCVPCAFVRNTSNVFHSKFTLVLIVGAGFQWLPPAHGRTPCLHYQEKKKTNVAEHKTEAGMVDTTRLRHVRLPVWLFVSSTFSQAA